MAFRNEDAVVAETPVPYLFFRYVSGALSSCYQFITGRIYYGYDRNELCSPLFKGYSLEL